MTKLEQIALGKLRGEIYDILDRCKKDNAERMEHERIFIEGSAKRALELIVAIEENASPNKA
jgi:hypothetical protein